MPEYDLDDTQPVAATQPVQPNQHAQSQPRRRNPRRWLIGAGLALLFLLLLGSTIAYGAYQGYQAAQQDYQRQAVAQSAQSLVEQYTLAMMELNAGEYDLARQRFEYVLARDPAFPGAAEGLAQSMAVLFATATPTDPPPTPTLTPTPDLRPFEDRFRQAEQHFEAGEWDALIDTLVALRAADPAYRTVDADSLLYRALLTRGLEKIRDRGELEGGIYDLSLAEKFGPLDSSASNYRSLARLYMIGLGFWEVYPEQAIYYFGQLAAAAPYLSDGSGWTSFERYYASILQFAGQLAAKEDWCAAQEQYELAQKVRPVSGVEPTLAFVIDQCSPPTATFTPTPTGGTLTLTPTGTVEATLTLTPTFPPGPSLTPTPTNPASPTATATATPTQPGPPPSATTTPTDAQPATDTPAPSETPTPTPTETPTPPDQGALPGRFLWLSLVFPAQHWLGGAQ
jgi:hypothetical protein